MYYKVNIASKLRQNIVNKLKHGNADILFTKSTNGNDQ